MSKMVERVAKAMHDWTCLAVHSLPAWDGLKPEHREQMIGQARAAIAALQLSEDDIQDYAFQNSAWMFNQFLKEALAGEV